MKIKASIQLYGLREESREDFGKVLEFVAQQGFQGVELAGYYGFSAQQLKEKVDSLGLEVMGSHESLERIVGETEDCIAYNLAVGNRNIICPGARTDSREDVENLIAKLSKANEAIQAAGMKLMYHNHSHEFQKLDGKFMLDVLRERMHAANFSLEVDTYWVNHAGVNPCDYLRAVAPLEIIHLKDGSKEGVPCAAGEGIMDLKAVLDTAEDMGVAWYVLENDDPVPTGYADTERSAACLKKLGAL